MERGRAIAAVAAVAVTSMLVTSSTWELWSRLEGHKSEPVLMPYPDIAKVWTVCRGHTGPDVVPGVAWTREQCNVQDGKNLTAAGETVVLCTNNVPLTRGQRDALTVFAGNVGAQAFCTSTLARRVWHQDYPAAEDQFFRWVYHSCRSIGGCQQSPGLFNRRVQEVASWRLPGEAAIYVPL